MLLSSRNGTSVNYLVLKWHDCGLGTCTVGMVRL